MSRALIVIDVQESFRQTKYWQEDDLETYLKQQNRLIAGSRDAGIPVLRVFHVEHDGGPFSLESGLVEPLVGSDPHSDAIFEKYVHSAMSSVILVNWLQNADIKHLIISGIRSEQCCETTTRQASDMGFKVDYVTEATLTFPMRHANGRLYSPAEIKERTELVLDGRFARVCTVDHVLSELTVTA